MKKYKRLVFVVLISVSFPALAGIAQDKLKHYMARLKSMDANFTQTLLDENMRQLEVANGKVYLQKPGKFRWDYQKPYQQTIVSDGTKLWLYDVELEQITVKSMKDALGSAPIALLTTDEPLEKQFKLTELGEIDSKFFVQLEANVKDTDYAYILLALNDKGLVAMELKDRLGQVTRIEFDKIHINEKIDDKHFTFTPPKGVDVIGE